MAELRLRQAGRRLAEVLNLALGALADATRLAIRAAACLHTNAG